jgi:DNA-binding response OmpR family regulator
LKDKEETTVQTGDAIRVLIVDDEEQFRANTAAVLNRRGFAVTAVGSGQEAIDAIKQHTFDVVVLDVKMPEMDGNEALREIKRIKPHLEIIMLTGHKTMQSAVDGLRGGVFDYLTKPCDIDVLASKIRDAHLSEKRLAHVERRARDIMVSLSSYSTIHEASTVAEAVGTLASSFRTIMTTGVVRESVHRSILVLDTADRVVGVLSFTDLLWGLQPEYMRLLRNRPETADSLHLEPFNYSGMFTIMVRDMGKKKVRDLMSEAPPTISADANLMEVAGRLLSLNVRRLLVMEGEKTVGLLREQDLFFEISRILQAP